MAELEPSTVPHVKVPAGNLKVEWSPLGRKPQYVSGSCSRRIECRGLRTVMLDMLEDGKISAVQGGELEILDLVLVRGLSLSLGEKRGHEWVEGHWLSFLGTSSVDRSQYSFT